MGTCRSRQHVSSSRYNTRTSRRNNTEPENQEEAIQENYYTSNIQYYTPNRFNRQPINTPAITIRIVRPSNLIERLDNFIELLNNIDNGMTNINPTDINKYNTYIINNQTTNSCTICLSNFQPKELITELPCNHLFHKNCLSQWFNHNNTCPLCKLTC